MSVLTHQEISVLFLSLGVILATARILGEIARAFHQPAVLGEIIAGILLGPTVLGSLQPEWNAYLFPPTGNVKIALEGFTIVAISLFLLVAGMEVDLSMAWRQGKTSLIVGFTGILFPFSLGFISAWFFRDLVLGEGAQDPLLFSLFFATAMSISALPVIAKILMDINLFRTDLGMIIIGAAIQNDLIGWNIFGLLIGMMESDNPANHHPVQTILWTLTFVVLMLTLGRWLIHRLLPWLLAHASWPGGILGFVLALSLFFSALTEWIGVHAIFGAFLFGIAIGDSPHLRQKVRTTIEQFVSFIFAPIFFGSIGLRVNFFANFDLLLMIVVIGIATIGKVGGCSLGARWCGLPIREAIATGVGMNARGAMEIILGLLALQKGLIDERMFVALAIMALLTSLSSGYLIQRILKQKLPSRFTDFLTTSRFQPNLLSGVREDAIRELSNLASKGINLDSAQVFEQVWNREQVMSTGLEKGIAVPHARIKNLKNPVVTIGISRSGVDFDSMDGQPTRLIFLILTPHQDNGSHLEILSDISRTFQNPTVLEQALQIRNYIEFLALVRSHEGLTG